MRKLFSLAVISLMFLSGSVAAANDNSNSTQGVQIALAEQATEKFETFINTLVHPIADPKDIECLAKNIFYESGMEPTEGKIAVGMVTINRSQDGRFPSTICGVVRQRTATSVPHTVKRTYLVKTGYFGKTEKRIETETTWKQVQVCQFSWYCTKVKTPREDDPRWIESQRVAQELADGGYEQYRIKYADAKHFHATYVKPGWKLKRISRVGNHVFYE